MSDIAITVEGLGKKYRIGHQKSGDFRNSVGEKIIGLLGRRSTTTEEFWALQDVSFEIKRGEAVGIIGRNGAGKSTLLKILSRITEPTAGRFEISGRVSSLLEVGTGFHPELTGRENIYLNGTILGMKRKEIKSKFDEIVAFSGVEKFLDTPVKHYSSGMTVRLAFSVAAHLEPEILIIDEVLAVGDAEFQKKCLGKMNEVSSKEGRTVLFVSHNMGAIRSLCTRALVLQNGLVKIDDNISSAISYYLEKEFSSGAKFEKPLNCESGYVKSVELFNEKGNRVKSIGFRQRFSLEIVVELVSDIKHFIVGLGMVTIEDQPIRTVWSSPADLGRGMYKYTFTERHIEFSSGKYKFIVGLSSREQTFQYVPDVIILEVEENANKTISVKSSSGVLGNSMEINSMVYEP